MSKKLDQSGFTIVELLIATTVFSVVLLICTVSMLQIGRIYYKGITSTKTQEAARAIMDDVTQAIQFSGGRVQRVTLASPSNFFCAGNKRYSFLLNRAAISSSATPTGDQARRVLVVDDNSSCAPSSDINVAALPTGAGGFTNPRDLLPIDMRLAKLEVDPVLGSDSLYQVTVRVVYGHEDVLNSTKDGCAPGRDGTQFCAVSELSTTVQKRVK